MAECIFEYTKDLPPDVEPFVLVLSPGLRTHRVFFLKPHFIHDLAMNFARATQHKPGLMESLIDDTGPGVVAMRRVDIQDDDDVTLYRTFTAWDQKTDLLRTYVEFGVEDYWLRRFGGVVGEGPSDTEENQHKETADVKPSSGDEV